MKKMKSREPECPTMQSCQKREISMVSLAGSKTLMSSSPKTTTNFTHLTESSSMAQRIIITNSTTQPWPTLSSSDKMLLQVLLLAFHLYLELKQPIPQPASRPTRDPTQSLKARLTWEVQDPWEAPCMTLHLSWRRKSQTDTELREMLKKPWNRAVKFHSSELRWMASNIQELRTADLELNCLPILPIEVSPKACVAKCTLRRWSS